MNMMLKREFKQVFGIFDIKEISGMYEYKLETYKIAEAEYKMNKLASDGWRVVAVSPNVAMGYGIVVTYEREKASLA